VIRKMRLAYYRLLISLCAVCCPLDRKIYTHNYQVLGLFIRAHNTVSYIAVGAGKTVCTCSALTSSRNG
jgi:hypothetical protein